MSEPEPITYRSGPIAGFLMSMIALASSIFGSEPKAPKPVTIQRLATAVCGSRIATHGTVTGDVASVRHEADGDYHLKLCAATGRPCVVVEPKERAAKARVAVRKGDRVEVTGITRWDSEHRWWEVHPATRIVVLGRAPSGKGRN